MLSSMGKCLGIEKNPEKIVEVRNPIWNTFHYCNFFQFSADFKLFKKIQVKTSLTGFCSLSLIACLITSTPELLFS
jgi:hypothetical protein